MSKPLEKILGYTFKTTGLLELALTHRSHSGMSNERLEFLGDSILNCVIALALYETLPKSKEGDLSRMRANLVNGNVLAELAREFKINEYIRLGSGELRSGGTQHTSILADAVEAIIGAIFLDQGFDAARQSILRWYGDRISKASHLTVIKDAKTRLQELTQAKKWKLPLYRILTTAGQEHHQTFFVECAIEAVGKVAQGSGKNRRLAEQDAAEAMLKQLEH